MYIILKIIYGTDRAERHDPKSRFLLFILLSLFPIFLGGKRKGKIITKVMILSHAFLHDHGTLYDNLGEEKLELPYCRFKMSKLSIF